MELAVLIYVAVLSGIIGALLYKYDRLRRDAEAYRRLTADRATPGPGGQPLTNPEEMARAIDAIALEVERISEGQRFVTRLLAERRRPDDRISPLSPIPGLGAR